MSATLRCSTRTPDTEEVPCPVCRSSSAVAVLRFEELELRTRSRMIWPIVECSGCRMVYVNPRPRQHIRDTYGGDAYGFARSVQADALVDGRRHCVRVLDEVEALVRVGSVLDVGCSTGQLLEEARARGWRPQGVEVSSHAAKVAASKGLKVTVGLLREAALPSGAFDAVTLLDVIEHLEEPAAELLEMHRLLRPGGILCVETPNWDSVYRRLLGQRWPALQPRLHILYFDVRSLTGLLERCGFEVIESRTEIVSLFSPEGVARGLGVGPRTLRWVARRQLVRLLLRLKAPWLDRFFLRLGRATSGGSDGSFRRLAEDVAQAPPAALAPEPAKVDGWRWRLLRSLNGSLDRALIARGRGDQLRILARRS